MWNARNRHLAVIQNEAALAARDKGAIWRESRVTGMV